METTTLEIFIRHSHEGVQEGSEALALSLLLCELLVRPTCFYTVQLGASIRDQFCQAFTQGLALAYIGLHRHRNRWTANSDEIWLNLRRACAGSKPDTLLPVF